MLRKPEPEDKLVARTKTACGGGRDKRRSGYEIPDGSELTDGREEEGRQREEKRRRRLVRVWHE